MSDIDPKHIEFFNELQELLKKHKAIILTDIEPITFKIKSDTYITPKGYVLYCSDMSDSFEAIELVTTERVFK